MNAFLRRDDGATAIEYALIAGCVSVLIVAAVNLLGQTVENTFFAKIAESM